MQDQLSPAERATLSASQCRWAKAHNVAVVSGDYQLPDLDDIGLADDVNARAYRAALRSERAATARITKAAAKSRDRRMVCRQRPRGAGRPARRVLACTRSSAKSGDSGDDPDYGVGVRPPAA